MTDKEQEPVNRGITERLNDAKAAVKGYIKKDQEKQTGKNYASLSHDAVTAHCRQAMIDNGILVSPTEIAHLHEDTGMRTNAGNPIFRWEVTLDVRFLPADYNYAEGADVHAITVTAHAFDAGDKAPGKAWSYAVKTALLKVLQLETGEDDESRVEIADNSKVISGEQLEQLRVAMENAELSEEQLIKHLNNNNRLNLESLGQLTVALWEYSMQRCARRKKILEQHRARAEAAGNGEESPDASPEGSAPATPAGDNAATGDKHHGKAAGDE